MIIAEAIKTAFGGASQVGPVDLARAIAGQVRNNGLGDHGCTLMEIVDAVCDAFDGEDYEHASDSAEVLRLTLADLG